MVRIKNNTSGKLSIAFCLIICFLSCKSNDKNIYCNYIELLMLSKYEISLPLMNGNNYYIYISSNFTKGFVSSFDSRASYPSYLVEFNIINSNYCSNFIYHTCTSCIDTNRNFNQEREVIFTVSPDGKRYVFLNNNNLHSKDIGITNIVTGYVNYVKNTNNITSAAFINNNYIYALSSPTFSSNDQILILDVKNNFSVVKSYPK